MEDVTIFPSRISRFRDAPRAPQIGQYPYMTASALSILFFARFSGKERKESHWCGERCQGRRFLVFILTLDTGLHTFTIDPGTKVRVLF
jgi:hypothetical protein